jgi:hypothetical protein
MGLLKKCNRCDGRGYTPYVFQVGHDDWDTDYDPCDICYSRGHFNLLLCLFDDLKNNRDVEHIWRGIPYKSYYDIW